MKIIIGIDASRNRSGGAKAHLIGILNNFNENLLDKIGQIHVWSYGELLNFLPDKEWLIKHNPKELNKSILHQLWWQYKKLPKEAKALNIDVLLNTDAGSICKFKPSVTMSRDMLSYEKGEIGRYKFGMEKIRLLILRYVQNHSLKNSSAAIFLTKYASEIIQQSSGPINEYTIIPHGVSNKFRITNKNRKNKLSNQDNTINCIYISSVAPYKHQWNVAQAISILRNEGYNIYCKFVGGGTGKAQKKFNTVLQAIKDSSSFIKQIDFVNHDEIPRYLENADIFVFASSCENMPNILIEGMCTGLPIACSNRGPMPEILKNGGVYFDPENVDSIVSSLKVIINDNTLRNEISSISQKLSENFSWEKCSFETFSYLCKIANKYKI